jgi:hypothetical protein
MLISYPTEAKDIEDGKIVADLTIEGDGNAGLMARWQSADTGEWSLYYCWIDNTSHFSCGKDVADAATEIASGQNNAIKKNAANHLSLTVTGNSAVFMVNNRKMVSFTDEDLTSGAFGVIADSADNTVTARYDRLVVTQP